MQRSTPPGEPERECGRSYTTRGADPYRTYCDLDASHDGPHEGPHPLIDDERIRWTGGGTIAGDPVPASVIDPEHSVEAQRARRGARVRAGRSRALRRNELPATGCGCECSRGGFCGGCGHAGCGGRR